MLTIDKEFQSIIPPLTPEEFQQLEANILAEGIREPIITWNGFIIDGHNRYEIATKHGLSYNTTEKQFESKEKVIEWMILNQFGRRNLSAYQRSLLALKLKPMFEEKAKENILSSQNNNKSSAFQKSDKQVHTSKELAKVAGVSHDTIAKVQKIEQQATPEIKQKLFNGEISINEAHNEIKKETKKQNRELDIQVIKNKAKEMPTNIKLIEGDLFDVIDQVDNDSIDLLNTDPPYSVLKDDWDTFEDKETFLNFTEKWLKLVMPKLKTTGRAYISIAQWYQYDLYNILKKHDFFGMTFKQNIIWYYKNNNQPSNRKEYRYMFEPIFYLYGKDADVLNFTPDTYGETQQNVWEIAMPQSNYKEGKFHSAQKPLELYRRIIKTGSKQGDKVLDCFAGSGTTGIICKELDRNCILIEKDKENAQIIRGRINE